MKSATLRTFQTVHTWTGLIAGLALFIAFYAGAITVFHEDIHAWQSPHDRLAAVESLAQGQALVEKIVAEHPAARESVRLLLGKPGAPQHTAIWQENGEWLHATSEGLDAPHSELSDFVYQLHYSLGLPATPGLYLMGVVSVIYGLAIVSGLILYLPTFMRDLFALRFGPNLTRMWRDAHNLIGVLSLPFHVMIAITSAVFCLGTLTTSVFDFAVFERVLAPKQNELIFAAPLAKAAGKPAAMLAPAQILEIGRRIAPDFEAGALHFERYGDANAQVSLGGTSPRALDGFSTLTLSAVDGHAIGIQVAGQRDANHASLSGFYGVHFANYGGYLVRTAYFLLGLAGAFLFYSGNLLWIASRRKRDASVPPRTHLWMARMTVGVALGCCVAVSALFVATQTLSPKLLTPGKFEHALYLVVFFACVVWAAFRSPARAAYELALAAALATLAIPLSNAIMTGDHLLASAQKGFWSVFGIDLAAIVLAVGFWRIARLTQRRTEQGDPGSIWALATTA